MAVGSKVDVVVVAELFIDEIYNAYDALEVLEEKLEKAEGLITALVDEITDLREALDATETDIM